MAKPVVFRRWRAYAILGQLVIVSVAFLVAWLLRFVE